MRWNDERGQTLIFTALSFFVLMAFVALATDIGLLFRERRQAQIAADAAAVAGAMANQYGASNATVQTVGKNASSTNGVTNGTGGATVTISSPPADGAVAGTTGFVEAQVSQPSNTVFMGLFGFKSINVTARAVAGIGTPPPYCLLEMGSTGDIAVSGSGTLNAGTCSIGADGAVMLAAGQKIVAGSLTMATPTEDEAAAGTLVTSTGTAITPTNAGGTISDPMASWASSNPVSAPGTCQGQITASITATATQTCFNGINVTSAGNVTITFPPNAGVIYINGPITYAPPAGSNSLTINANGDMLYVAGATAGNAVSMSPTGNGTVNLNLTAPSTGTYKGVALWVPGGPPYGYGNAVADGGNLVLNVNGIVYAPSSPVQLSGNDSGTLNSDMIVGDFMFSGTLSMNNYAGSSPLGSGGSGTGAFTMVE